MSVRHGMFAANGAENPRTASVQPADQHKHEISCSSKPGRPPSRQALRPRRQPPNTTRTVRTRPHRGSCSPKERSADVLPLDPEMCLQLRRFQTLAQLRPLYVRACKVLEGRIARTGTDRRPQDGPSHVSRANPQITVLLTRATRVTMPLMTLILHWTHGTYLKPGRDGEERQR